MTGVLLTKTQLFSQVIFEGIVGHSFTGDIAIDSVELNSGICPGKNKPICICIFLACVWVHLCEFVENDFSSSAGGSLRRQNVLQNSHK